MASLESANPYFIVGGFVISRQEILEEIKKIKLNDLDKFLIFEIFKHITDYQSFENLRLVNKEFYTLVKHYFGHLNYHQDLVRDNKINIPLNPSVLKLEKIKDGNYDSWLKRRVCKKVKYELKSIFESFIAEYRWLNCNHYGHHYTHRANNKFHTYLHYTFHKETIEQVLNTKYEGFSFDFMIHLKKELIQYTGVLIMDIAIEHIMREKRKQKKNIYIEKWKILKECKTMITTMKNMFYIQNMTNLRNDIMRILTKDKCVAFTFYSFIRYKKHYSYELRKTHPILAKYIKTNLPNIND